MVTIVGAVLVAREVKQAPRRAGLGNTDPTKVPPAPPVGSRRPLPGWEPPPPPPPPAPGDDASVGRSD
jgi:hypothetical protein